MVPKEQARELAQEVMEDPERALAEKIQTELKIGEVYATPFQEGWITGLATAIGAFIRSRRFSLLKVYSLFGSRSHSL